MTEIPWSVSWSGEQAFRLTPSADHPGLLELDQKEAPGVGEPLFAQIHVARHRRGMVRLLCHVCGKPTPPRDRYIFPTASGGLVTLHDGTRQYGCNVPPMHKACTLRANQDCPHLTKIAEPPLRLDRDEGRLIHRTDRPKGLEALKLDFPPGADVIFSYYRLYSPEFTAKVLRARAEWEAASAARRAEMRRAAGRG
jgi:hypothetical protein